MLAEAVASATKNKALRFMLEEKNLLAEELQHRVRNNLQMISGMLSEYARGAADNSVRQSIDTIVRRVTTLAQVYDSLLGVGLRHTVDLGSDLRERCISLPELQDSRSERIDIVCQADSIPLSLDSVTAFGIVVAELVTNSFGHAFPDRGGTIVVTLARAAGSRDATLLIKDDGGGYVAKIASSRRGLGLVKRLMEQVRGTLDVYSGDGTVWPDVPGACSQRWHQGRRLIRGDGLAAGRRLGS